MFELKMNYFLPPCVLQIKNTKQKLHRKDISHLKIIYLKNLSDYINNTTLLCHGDKAEYELLSSI